MVIDLDAIRNPSEALILPLKCDFPEVASFGENAIYVKVLKIIKYFIKIINRFFLFKNWCSIWMLPETHLRF